MKTIFYLTCSVTQDVSNRTSPQLNRIPEPVQTNYYTHGKNKKLEKFLTFLTLLLFLSLGFQLNAQPGGPIGCVSNAYLTMNIPTDVFTVNLVSGTTTEVASNITPGTNKINAIGYNATDGYIWGFLLHSTQVARIGADFVPQYFNIPGLPISSFIVGDVSADGKFYLYRNGQTNIYIVDINPASATYLTLVSTLPTTPSYTSDWAFSPIDGNLYAINGDHTNRHLYRFDPLTGSRTDMGLLTGGGINDEGALGGQYMDADGNLYGSRNTDGKIFRILTPHLGNLTAEFFTNGPITGSGNDGARCNTAPIDLDFGDAPDSYLTTLASNGPRHSLSNPADNPIRMGAGVTAEIDANTPLDGSGDANDDGVSTFPLLTSTSTSYSLNITVTNNSGSTATLFGWIDFNLNGTFEASEAATTTVTDGTTGDTATLNWNGLSGLNAGTSYARFRLTTDTTITTSTPGGSAANGEVEDYQIPISTPIPVSNWAIILSVFLIAAFTVYHIRKRKLA